MVHTEAALHSEAVCRILRFNGRPGVRRRRLALGERSNARNGVAEARSVDPIENPLRPPGGAGRGGAKRDGAGTDGAGQSGAGQSGAGRGGAGAGRGRAGPGRASRQFDLCVQMK